MNKQYESFLKVTHEPRMLYGVFKPTENYIRTVLDTEPRWKNQRVKEKYNDQVNEILKELDLNFLILPRLEA